MKTSKTFHEYFESENESTFFQEIKNLNHDPISIYKFLETLFTSSDNLVNFTDLFIRSVENKNFDVLLRLFKFLDVLRSHRQIMNAFFDILFTHPSVIQSLYDVTGETFDHATTNKYDILDTARSLHGILMFYYTFHIRLFQNEKELLTLLRKFRFTEKYPPMLLEISRIHLCMMEDSFKIPVASDEISTLFQSFVFLFQIVLYLDLTKNTHDLIVETKDLHKTLYEAWGMALIAVRNMLQPSSRFEDLKESFPLLFTEILSQSSLCLRIPLHSNGFVESILSLLSLSEVFFRPESIYNNPKNQELKMNESKLEESQQLNGEKKQDDGIIRLCWSVVYRVMTLLKTNNTLQAIIIRFTRTLPIPKSFETLSRHIYTLLPAVAIPLLRKLPPDMLLKMIKLQFEGQRTESANICSSCHTLHQPQQISAEDTMRSKDVDSLIEFRSTVGLPLNDVPVILKICSQCKITSYCNTKCFHTHWKEHKSSCIRISKSVEQFKEQCLKLD